MRFSNGIVCCIIYLFYLIKCKFFFISFGLVFLFWKNFPCSWTCCISFYSISFYSFLSCLRSIFCLFLNVWIPIKQFDIQILCRSVDLFSLSTINDGFHIFFFFLTLYGYKQIRRDSKEMGKNKKCTWQRSQYWTQSSSSISHPILECWSYSRVGT